jgi:hypothetical protein
MASSSARYHYGWAFACRTTRAVIDPFRSFIMDRLREGLWSAIRWAVGATSDGERRLQPDRHALRAQGPAVFQNQWTLAGSRSLRPM